MNRVQVLTEIAQRGTISPKLAWQLLQDLVGPFTKEKASNVEDDLMTRWYESNCTDYGIYNDPEYMMSLAEHTCRRSLLYTKLGLNWLETYLGGRSVTLLDHGAGAGLTTAVMAARLPSCRVVGSNLPGRQLEVNQLLQTELQLSNLEFQEPEQIGRCEVVVSFDSLEHFKQPLAEVLRLYSETNMSVLIESSSFSVPSPGHFTEYFMGDRAVVGSSPGPAARLFHLGIRKLTFKRDSITFWNNRPLIWVREK